MPFFILPGRWAEPTLGYWTIKRREHSGAPESTADQAKEVEAALKVFVEAKTPEEKRRAAASLEQMTKKLRDQVSPETSAPPGQ
jgi:hypothetical protein